MSTHECPNCQKTFQRKGHLSSHLNKKFKCKSVKNIVHTISYTYPYIPVQNNGIGGSISYITPYNPVQNTGVGESISYSNQNFPTQNHIINVENKKIQPPQNKRNQNISPVKVNIINPPENNLPIQNNNTKNKIFQCTQCSKILSDSNSLRRHIKQYCKAKKNNDESLKEKNKQLEEQIKKLEEENKNLKYVTINNNTQINNINITLVDHGKEDLSKIANFLLLIASKRGINAIPELIDQIHFNPNYPEFHNIYIPSIKDKHIMVYNKNWEVKNTADVVSDIYEERKNFIIDNKDVFYNLLDEGQKRSYNRWVKYDNDRSTAEAKQFILETFDKIKLLLFNKKNIPIDTKKQLESIEKIKI